jgi:very-short-patch-repair endonuclease
MKLNMHIFASPRIFGYAKSLRANPTPAEQILWEHLRDRRMEGEKFRRQHPSKKFILDFYCYKYRLGIELDGEQHASPVNQFYDNDRTEILEGYTLHILRFTNQDVYDRLDFVLETIRQKIFYLRKLKG